MLTHWLLQSFNKPLVYLSPHQSQRLGVNLTSWPVKLNKCKLPQDIGQSLLGSVGPMALEFPTNSIINTSAELSSCYVCRQYFLLSQFWKVIIIIYLHPCILNKIMRLCSLLYGYQYSGAQFNMTRWKSWLYGASHYKNKKVFHHYIGRSLSLERQSLYQNDPRLTTVALLLTWFNFKPSMDK